ncbi:MAG: MBL fold metallo-hydrolase [Balneolaceae bacterium]
MKSIPLLTFLLFTFSTFNCSNIELENEPQPDQYITVLGIAQDAGFPQAGCEKENCRLFWEGKEEARHATSLGLVDKESGQFWMFEATPDFKHQLKHLNDESAGADLSGIFLTHAHIGHYSGLMHLGHEVMGASEIPVYTMPRMKNYLETNGPWSQLVEFENITLNELAADSSIQISENLSVTPFLVPHRDEYSETVGYRIESLNSKVLFIPDINKWDIWERSIVEEIAKVDYAFLDATFFDQDELPGRDISQIPHPFVSESIELFKDLPASEKEKVIFIHFNHTNSLILESSDRKYVESLGFKVAYEGMNIGM